MFRRILCALDLTGSAEVLKMAAQLARTHAAELILLYVVDSPMLTLTAGSGPLKLPENEAEAVNRASITLKSQADAHLRQLAADLGPGVQTMVLEGPPIAGRILDAVEKVRPDVLVIGIHERRGLRRFLVGSVADKVIRHCPVSLLVVRPPAVEPRIRLVDDEHQGG